MKIFLLFIILLLSIGVKTEYDKLDGTRKQLYVFIAAMIMLSFACVLLLINWKILNWTY